MSMTTARRDVMTQLNSLNDVLVEQIADLQSAEQQLISALPKMAQAASDGQLREAFQTHLEETRGHAERLTKVVGMLGGSVPAEECQAMKGLIAEGEDVINATGDPAAKDAALIAAAQRVEHYEIAAYGTARTLSDQLGMGDAAGLLDQTLNEESHADELLNKLATGGMFSSGINEKASV
jgi:ferritin-like metal-binding protein YciE